MERKVFMRVTKRIGFSINDTPRCSYYRPQSSHLLHLFPRRSSKLAALQPNLNYNRAGKVPEISGGASAFRATVLRGSVASLLTSTHTNPVGGRRTALRTNLN